MNFLQFLLLSFITFAGGLIGLILAKVTEEELTPAKKYFKIALPTIFLAVIFLLFFFNSSIAISVLVVLLAAVILYWIRHRTIEYLMYGFLAIMFYIGTLDPEHVLFFSVLIFAYGFPKAALFYLQHPKLSLEKKLVLYAQKNGYFLVIALFLYVLSIFL